MTAPPSLSGSPRTAFLRWEAGAGTYKGGSPYEVTDNVRFKARWGVFTSVADVAAYLLTFNGQGSEADPIPLPVSIDLSSTGSDNWASLLSALDDAAAREYVDLDLSTSTMTGTTEFNPGTANTGEKWIASLTLPDAATSVAAGPGTGCFRFFTKLREISGANIETVPRYAFKSTTSLKSVSFPKATTFGEWTMHNTGLITVYLPAVTDLKEGVFLDCTDIITVNLPGITTLPLYTFYGNTHLRTAILPKTTTIGIHAFDNCPLTSITIPDGCTIEDDTIQGGFRDYYYNTTGMAGGVYIYGQLGWTGPF
jgi:hypothetical protein